MCGNDEINDGARGKIEMNIRQGIVSSVERCQIFFGGGGRTEREMKAVQKPVT